jgi:ABC-type amino acid transport substrate-binding protein
VVVVPPFVVEQSGSLTGFSIDLWNAIATRLKLKASYQIVPVVALLLGALSVSCAIFLILELDLPFERLIRISDEPLRKALAHLGQ